MTDFQPQGEADARWIAAAAALALRNAGRARPNPDVGCILVAPDGRVVGTGVTAPGGRPHAEAIACAQAGAMASGATAYVTLEPCAHASPRGAACADALIAAGVARVVVTHRDPDPRTGGAGLDRLAAAGIIVDRITCSSATRSLADWLLPARTGRPLVTLKLATSLDGCIATGEGASRWITGPAARAQVHRLRASVDAVLVGRGTLLADAPALDVRLPGLARQPRRVALSRSGEPLPPGWEGIAAPEDIASLDGVRHLLVEGGAGAAAAMLDADLVDRLSWFHAPIVIGGGLASVGALGRSLASLPKMHGRWALFDERMLGPDRMATYERADGRFDFADAP